MSSGVGFKLVSAQSVPLTKELAKEFNAMAPSPTERGIDPKRLKHLEEKARHGQLVTFHWSRAKYKGKAIRMNGQHSSTMLCQLNGDFPNGLFAHIDDYEVDSEKDLALLFRQFDDRKSSRNTLDISGAYQGLVDVLREVDRKSAKMAIEGITWYLRVVEGVPGLPSGDDVYQQFNETRYHTFIQWIGDLFNIKTPEMKRTHIVASMYATFIANEAEARRFWEQVARGGQPYEDKDATTALSAWYIKVKNREMREPPKPAEMYQAGIFAWNAYRSEKPVTSLKTDTKKGLSEPSG